MESSTFGIVESYSSLREGLHHISKGYKRWSLLGNSSFSSAYPTLNQH